MSPSKVQSMLVTRNLTVVFTRWGQEITALAGVSFEVSPGEWVAIVGHNGSGKSTLLNAIAGSIPLHLGDVIIDGRPKASISRRKLARIVFTVHQNPGLGTAPLLTVWENLRVADPAGDVEQYDELLHQVGLSDRKHQPAKSLSGGERQLLALTIARLRRPRLLLLDEPLAALDPERARMCVCLISEIHKGGATVLQVTHDLETLAPLVDRTLSLDHGRLIADRIRPSRQPVHAI